MKCTRKTIYRLLGSGLSFILFLTFSHPSFAQIQGGSTGICSDHSGRNFKCRSRGSSGGSSSDQMMNGFMNNMMNNMIKNQQRSYQNNLARARERQRQRLNQQSLELNELQNLDNEVQEDLARIRREEEAKKRNEFQSAKNRMLGLMRDTIPNLGSQDSRSLGTLEVEPQNDVFGTTSLKPREIIIKNQNPEPELNDKSASMQNLDLKPREIVIPQARSQDNFESLPVVDPKVIQGNIPPKYTSLKTKEVPSPWYYKTEQERRDQLDKLSDKDIEDRIELTKNSLKRLQGDFEKDVKSLEMLAEEGESALRDGLTSVGKLIMGESLKKMGLS